MENTSDEKILVKVNVQNLMKQAAIEMRSFPVSYGFQVAVNYLDTAARRALEINDPVIVAVFENLGIINDDDAQEYKKRQAKLIEYQEIEEKKRTSKAV